jgi:hypothetical protein
MQDKTHHLNSSEMYMGPKFLRTPAIIILVLFIGCQDGFSFSVIMPRANGNKTEVAPPDYIKASVFVKLSPRQFAEATGKDLNFFQKVYFRMIQRQIKRDLKKNPDLLINNYFDQKKGKFKLSLLWFIIAAFIGPLGVLFAYTSHHQPKELITRKDKTTSAWLGLLFFILWFGFLFVF